MDVAIVFDDVAFDEHGQIGNTHRKWITPYDQSEHADSDTYPRRIELAFQDIRKRLDSIRMSRFGWWQRYNFTVHDLLNLIVDERHFQPFLIGDGLRGVGITLSYRVNLVAFFAA